MFENIKSFATSGKDAVVATLVKQIANHKLQEKAPGTELQSLILDSKKKNITATILLPECEEPLIIKAIDYSINTHNEKHFLEVAQIEKSHPWENSYIDGKRYKIPPEVVKAASFIL